MHRRTPGRLAALIASAVLLLLVLVPTALGKEGVSVTLVAPIPGDAQPGTIVPVFFTMTAISDDVGSPLVGASVFFRLHGPGGASTEAPGVEQATPGLYKALIEIPAGGIGSAEFGIRGPAKTATGKVVASDVVWSYDGLLVSAKVPAPVDPKAYQLPGAKPAVEPQANGTATAPAPADPAAANGLAVDPRLVLAVALGLAVVVAGAILGRRRRMHGPTTA